MDLIILMVLMALIIGMETSQKTLIIHYLVILQFIQSEYVVDAEEEDVIVKFLLNYNVL